MTRLYRSSLHSFHARRKHYILWFSIWFLFLIFVLLYIFHQKIYMFDSTFRETLFWCLIPCLLVVRLQYKTMHLATSQRVIMLLVNTQLPFLLLVLFFALFQQPYSRSAIFFVALLVLLWFGLAEFISQKNFKLKLLVFDPVAIHELNKELPLNHAFIGGCITFVEWTSSQLTVPDCDGILLPSSGELSDHDMAQVSQAKKYHLRFYSPAAVSELLTGRIAISELKKLLWQPEDNPAFDIAKRISDFFLVLVTAPVWIMLSAMVGLAIKLDSPGPIFFIQWRTGQHGKPFKIFKFRTMFVEAQAVAQFAETNDRRITRLGHFLRRSRLDEIPQLVNVLLGQMSLIGPRPEQYIFVSEFAINIPSYPYRHIVRPGITGWAQVMQGYSASEEETFIKLSYDLYYVKHYSLGLDLLIAVKTIKTILTGFGAR